MAFYRPPRRFRRVTRRGFAPLTDCMMMVTFSSVGVSMITLTRHRFHFVSSYHVGQFTQQKNIFMAIQPAPITVPSHIKNNWDNPKPAYAATSERWTKFTGLRASPNYLLKARSVGVEPTITALSAGSVIQTDFASTTLQARLDTCSTALLPVLRPYIAIGSR